MELKEFIKQALSDIANAVSESQEELKEVAVINPPANNHANGPMSRTYFYDKHTINFDIAVSASSENEKSGGVKVLSALAGGISSNTTNQEFSRITFSIPVYLSKGQLRDFDKLVENAQRNPSPSCVLPTTTVKQS